MNDFFKEGAHQALCDMLKLAKWYSPKRLLQDLEAFKQTKQISPEAQGLTRWLFEHPEMTSTELLKNIQGARNPRNLMRDAFRTNTEQLRPGVDLAQASGRDFVQTTKEKALEALEKDILRWQLGPKMPNLGG